MDEDFRLLIPAERQKLPPCSYAVFGRCDLDVKKRMVAECVRCWLTGCSGTLWTRT
jgi:hypothetical protein